MAKNIFIASTRPHTGKGIICLGLINALRGIVSSVGYFKPIGQKYVKNDKYDIESILIKNIFNIEDELEHINPISIEELNQYISNNANEALFQKIHKAYKKIDKEIIENVINERIKGGLDIRDIDRGINLTIKPKNKPQKQAGRENENLHLNDFRVKLIESQIEKIEQRIAKLEKGREEKDYLLVELIKLLKDSFEKRAGTLHKIFEARKSRL